MVYSLANIMKKKALIIGGGFAGCSAAHLLSLKNGWEITLVERSSFLGAGVKTQFYGGHPYTFGPRHFLTQNEKVYEFLNKYCPLRDCDHEFITYVEEDKNFYSYPIHVDDIEKMPEEKEIRKELLLKDENKIQNSKNLEEYWINSVGKTLYEKFVDNYSKKMWQIEDNTLLDDFSWSPKGVALKEGSKEAWDQSISCYPIALDGYNSYFDIATENVNVLLSTNIEKFDVENYQVTMGGEDYKFDLIINTISPDTLFEECYGELPFIGRDFYPIILPCENAFPDKTYFVYYAGKEKFTRVVEYKKFTKYKSSSTLIGLEIPSKNGKHYPLPFKSEIERSKKYLDLLPENVFSIGRAGSYQYYVDIDDCIDQAMQVIENL